MKPDSYYNQNAKPGCKNCEGKGLIRYYFDQDDCKTAPCVQCFPDERWARQAHEQFYERFGR